MVGARGGAGTAGCGGVRPAVTGVRYGVRGGPDGFGGAGVSH